jgi:hypothetical protein
MTVNAAHNTVTQFGIDRGTLANGGRATIAQLPMPHRSSRFEYIAARAHNLPPHLVRLLGALLETPVCDAAASAQAPLWAEERMHRAYSVLRLISTLSVRDRSHPADPLTIRLEYTLACHLAAQFRMLPVAPDGAVVPCSSILRDVITALAALFGTTPRPVEVATDVECLSLPSLHRRALVLAASELMVNALSHAFRGRTHGRILVSLRRAGLCRVQLRVADDGVGFRNGSPDTVNGVAAGLAALLGAQLTYHRTAAWQTIAEIAIPTSTARL